MSIYRDLENLDIDVQQAMSRVLANWYMSKSFRYENDFFDWDTDESEWTVTETNATGTQTIEDAAGGVLALLTDDLSTDSIDVQKVGEAFKLTTGKPLYFESRFAVNCTDIDNPTVVVGLCITDTDLTGGMSDGVYFIKDNGNANLDFVAEKDSAETEKADTGVDLVDNTFVTVGFYFDGSGNVTPYINGTAGTSQSTDVPDDEELCVSFAMLNGEAAANTLRIDYVKVVQNR